MIDFINCRDQSLPTSNHLAFLIITDIKYDPVQCSVPLFYLKIVKIVSFCFN